MIQRVFIAINERDLWKVKDVKIQLAHVARPRNDISEEKSITNFQQSHD